MARISWSAAALGATVVPVLLIHGTPWIFVPEGFAATGLSISSPPSEWWPANDYAGSWSPNVKPYLSLAGDGIRISEKATPTQSQLINVSEVTLTLSDVDGATTLLLSNANNAVVAYITADITAAATTIPVTSTTGFASSGVVYLDQEAIAYGSKDATNFLSCTRAQYGSTAARHLYSTAQGQGNGIPAVMSIPAEIIGRPATLWLAQVSSAGVITAIQLEFFGLVGGGAALNDIDGWVVTLDHASKRLAQTIRPATVQVEGYAHPGNLGARTTIAVPGPGDMGAGYFLLFGGSGGAASKLVILTGDAADPDHGGWHPSRESFVGDYQRAGATLIGASAFTASIDGGGYLTASWNTGATTYNAEARWPWEGVGLHTEYTVTSAAAGHITSRVPMPPAWIPIVINSPVYLSASDYAQIPAAPSLDGSAGASNTSAVYCLVFGDANNPRERRVATIGTATASGGVYSVACTGLVAPSGGTLFAIDERGIGHQGFVVTEPTPARLGLYVKSDFWWTALQYAVQALDVEYASVAAAIDWTTIAAVAATSTGGIDVRRETVYDLNTTVLGLLANEAALNGLSVVMHNGKIAVARIAEFAITETTVATITTSDLHREHPVPGYEKGADGIVNLWSVKIPEANTTINVTDGTSRALYGTQGAITCELPRTIATTAPNAAGLYAQLSATGLRAIGPHRYPYEHITVHTPLHLADVQVGDLVTGTLWRIPNGSGTRGISAEVLQVVGRETWLFGDAHEGHVAYILRRNPQGIAGYAPSMLVAAGGIAAGVVTQDVITIAGGFSGTSLDAGTFAVGDLVRLHEINNASPTASTLHSVTAVGASTITLSPAPSGTFSALAAAALKVMVDYDDWSAVAPSHTLQMRYAFLAASTLLLDSTHPARRFAA